MALSSANKTTFRSDYFFLDAQQESAEPSEVFGAIADQDAKLDDDVAKLGEATVTQDSVGPFNLGPILGRGCTGTVRLGTHKDTGFQVAFKIMKKKHLNSKPKLWSKVKREIAILKLIEHPHILKLYDVLETQDRLYLVLENVKGGELFDYIIAKGRLDRDTSLRLFAQIVQGLEQCHAHSICHRDLKPENLLLDEKVNIKIADFGMAQLMKENGMLHTSCGSPHYASPEIINGGAYDGKRTDVWSIGVILYALVTGSLPFDDDCLPALLNKVAKGEYYTPSWIPEDVSDLISRMLTVDPNQRIRMSQIKRHRAFHGTTYFPPKAESVSSPATQFRSLLATESLDENILGDLESLGWGKREEMRDKLLNGTATDDERVFYRLLLDRKKRRLNELSRLSPKPKQTRSLAGGGGLNSVSPPDIKRTRSLPFQRGTTVLATMSAQVGSCPPIFEHEPMPQGATTSSTAGSTSPAAVHLRLQTSPVPSSRARAASTGHGPTSPIPGVQPGGSAPGCSRRLFLPVSAANAAASAISNANTTSGLVSDPSSSSTSSKSDTTTSGSELSSASDISNGGNHASRPPFHPNPSHRGSTSSQASQTSSSSQGSNVYERKSIIDTNALSLIDEASIPVGSASSVGSPRFLPNGSPSSPILTIIPNDEPSDLRLNTSLPDSAFPTSSSGYSALSTSPAGVNWLSIAPSPPDSPEIIIHASTPSDNSDANKWRQAIEAQRLRDHRAMSTDTTSSGLTSGPSSTVTSPNQSPTCSPQMTTNSIQAGNGSVSEISSAASSATTSPSTPSRPSSRVPAGKGKTETSEDVKRSTATTPRFHRRRVSENEEEEPVVSSPKQSWFSSIFQRRPSLDIAGLFAKRGSVCCVYSKKALAQVSHDMTQSLTASNVAYKQTGCVFDAEYPRSASTLDAPRMDEKTSTSGVVVAGHSSSAVDDAVAVATMSTAGALLSAVASLSISSPHSPPTTQSSAVVASTVGTPRARQKETPAQQQQQQVSPSTNSPSPKTAPQTMASPVRKVAFTIELTHDKVKDLRCIKFSHRSGDLAVYQRLTKDIQQRLRL